MGGEGELVEAGRDVDLVRASIAEARAVLPPAVLCEALSDPALPPSLVEDIASLLVLELHDDENPPCPGAN